MEWSLLIKGFVIGLSIAAPVGPIGILCIQRTLSSGNVQGLVTGLGAATADALYGFIAAFGLTFISNFFSRSIYLVSAYWRAFSLLFGNSGISEEISGADGFGGKQQPSFRLWHHLFPTPNPFPKSAFFTVHDDSSVSAFDLGKIFQELGLSCSE